MTLSAAASAIVVDGLLQLGSLISRAIVDN
jgi:hypothetical protein